MSVRRTAAVDVDEIFVALGSVCKTHVDETTGKRYIRGVASGVEEDRDGERVSANAIRKMAASGPTGVKITAGHDQDWLTEFGDVIKIGHDAATDELLVDCELPPEGEDPIADKAFKRACNEQLGFSIGGKLKKAYYELVDGGTAGAVRKRKVLDEILLAHVALTKKPAYASSFATAVAKTFKDEAPAEDAEVWKTLDHFADEDLVVAKDADNDAEDAEATPGSDGASATEPPAGTADTGADSDAKADQEDAAQLPVARHLACPNCGHEFAAPLEADEPQNRSDAENGGDDAAKTASSTAPDTRKDMANTSPTDALAKIRALADAAVEAVTKTETAPAETDVTKTETTDVAAPAVADEVAKTLAEGLVALDAKTAESLDTVAKALQGVIERIELLPLGRKSVARVLPTRDEVEKTENPDEADPVAKTVADPNATALDVLKAQNAARGVS